VIHPGGSLAGNESRLDWSTTSHVFERHDFIGDGM
jgi:hypothetical protein